MKARAITAILTAIMLASCSAPKDIVYFQDTYAGQEMATVPQTQITIQPHDQLFINVSCSDPRLTEQFNLTSASSTHDSDNFMGYTVNSNGYIDFPFLGEVKVAGMTREEIATKIKHELQMRDLVKDPVVTVNLANFGVVVLGEVNKPGRVDIVKDRLTLLDAIAQTGDLTINGVRTNVKVIRQEGDKQHVYTVDLTDATGLYTSPVYYLQQDDLIYVEPNKNTMRATTANGNSLQTIGFWMSLLTFLTSIGVMVVK